MNLIIYIFFYAVIYLSILGYGFLYFKIINYNPIKINIGYIGLGGTFILILISYLTNFFLQHNIYHNLFILFFGIIAFFKFLKHYYNENSFFCKLSILVFSVLFISILIFKNHDDFPYYHFPYTFYLIENNLIYGVGNLNHGFRTPSSIFYLNSLFYLPLIKYFSFTYAAVYIFGSVNLVFLEKIFKINHLNPKIIKKNQYNFINYLFLLSFIFINVFFYRIAEHGTDRSAQILVILLIIELLLFLNISKNNNVSPLLYLIVGIIISLKSFYILYLIFIIPIIKYFWSNKKKFLFFKKIFFNINFLLLLLVIVFILFTFFFNTGCFVYPISFTCIDFVEWSIPKTEVKAMNEWYELWSKAGATPGERVTNPDLYIKEFNWVANWFDNYFFNKVSDFLLGLIFAGLLVLSSFYYFSKKVKINIKKRKYLIIYLILFILFFEWFYNHPALRYGGFCLIFLILFIPFSLFLEKINIGDIKFVKLSNIFISLTILIFFARNVDRLYDEIKIYDYNPLTYTFYNVETQHFRINKQINDLINYYEICSKSSEECIFKSSIKIKKQKNKYIIYKK